MQPPGDEDLVRQSQEGRREAFEELVRRTARLVYARLRLDCPDTHVAEDLTQETFLRAWRSIKSLREANQLRAWLLSIAHRVLIDQSRKRKWKLNGQEIDVADARGDPSTKLSGDDARQQALDALKSLPEEYRLPLSLRYLGGAGHEEIEQQLGLTNGSLRGLLHRGLRLLRERLKED